MGDYDRSSKWLIQHHGDALLRLAGLSDIRSWRPLQAEVVQPGQLPDGLVEAEIAGSGQSTLFVLEIATYPEQRLIRQLLRDGLLVFLDRDRLPEILTFLLHPKGQLEIPDFHAVISHLGWTELNMRWRVVALWNLNAEDLLAAQDPGLVPWVPLTRFAGPPEPVLQRCREIIDRQARPEEHTNLLAVTQVLARLRYNDPQLLMILGGRRIMIESPLIQELVEEAEARGKAAGRTEGKAEGKAEGKHEAILTFLQARFGLVPEDLADAVSAIGDERILDSLLTHAARCRSLATFRTRIPS